MAAEHVVLAGYVACLIALWVYSLSMAHLALVVRRTRRGRSGAATPLLDDSAADAARTAPPRSVTPSVTVQLPIFNELHVARRVIDAAAGLDHPRDRLRVQVLDDSTDATRDEVDAAAAWHRERGLPIEVVRRHTRDGYKAGALAKGLARDDAEFVMVLDADFVPRRDLIARLLAGFDAPDVGAVQARWGFLNADASAVTRVEAFLLDLHFAVEQPGRAAAGGFLNFNGTAGMWRRAAIEDAGGWRARTVTEDIDLSYRAQLRGWRIAYLGDVDVPSELPADLAGVRSQQHRWIKGGAQNARIHLGAVLRRPGITAATRWHAAAHLVSGSLYAVILAMLVLTVPLAALKNTAIETDYVDWGMPLAFSTLALGWTMAVAAHPRSAADWRRFAVLLPAFLVFTMGLSVHNGRAALSGWLGRPGGEFVRTPKAGSAGWRTTYAAVRVDRRVLYELAVLAWLGVGLGIAWVRREPALVPLQLMAVAGLSWVVALSLWHPVRSRRTGLATVTAPRGTVVLSTEEVHA
ncbi:MAG TPA: glycosyltransferase [Dermatophilaceae bacterium]|nr:glycosyltransferase [Dermatophilaceae bacterium]